MSIARYQFVEPGRDRRERDAALKRVLKMPAGAERAVRLADLARQFHDHRELNQAMTCAAQCLRDDPDPPRVLCAAYRRATDPESRLDELSMLVSLGRWLNEAQLAGAARDAARGTAQRWCAAAEGDHRERRLERVRRRFDAELAATVAALIEA